MCSFAQIDKLSPKLSSLIVIKISSRRNCKLKILFNNNVILILTAVQILTPTGCSTIQLSYATVYPEIISDANYNSRCYLWFWPTGCKLDYSPSFTYINLLETQNLGNLFIHLITNYYKICYKSTTRWRDT